MCFRVLAFVAFVFGAVSCAQVGVVPKTARVYKYEHFGPQVMANEIIGMAWWQWEDHGGSRPQKFDIKVVVYSGYELSEVKAMYRVVPDNEQDYRYVPIQKALNYLDRHIQENFQEKLTRRLKVTRNELSENFDTE